MVRFIGSRGKALVVPLLTRPSREEKAIKIATAWLVVEVPVPQLICCLRNVLKEVDGHLFFRKLS